MTEYNKVVYDGQTLIDLTQDDVTASDVRQGVYFHSADGVRSQGTLQSMSKNIWYAECSTASSTASKEATSTSGDFVLEVGNMVRVKMSNADGVSSSTLSVDGCTPTLIRYLANTASTARWTAGEVVDFVYDGSAFVMSDGGVATTSYYGNTRLSNSVDSTSTTLSATPSAVKQAYDLAKRGFMLGSYLIAKGDGDDGNLTLSTSYKQIPLTIEDTSVGYGFAHDIDENKIRCEYDGIILAMGQIRVQGSFTTSDIVNLRIESTGGAVSTIRYRAWGATPSTDVVLRPQPFVVSEGDMFGLYAYNATGARGTIAIGSCILTLMYIAPTFT